MDNKKRLILVSLVAVSALGGVWWRTHAAKTPTAPKARQGSATPLPYTAIRSDVTLVPGKPDPTHTEMRTLAVRSDGSNVELFHRRDPSGSGKVVYMRRILDVPGKQIIVVDPISESLITSPLVNAAVRNFAIKPASQCAGVPAAQILGYDVALEEASVGPQQAGPAVDELRIRAWRTPRLNCLPLRREITLFKGGQEIEHIIETVVTVAEGEPDGSFFEVPQGYVERSPSAAMSESARRYPSDKEWQCNNCAQSQAKKDEAYFHRWKHFREQK